MTTEQTLVDELARHLDGNTTAISRKPEELTFDISHKIGNSDIRFRFRAIALKGLLCLEADLGIVVPVDCAGCRQHAQDGIDAFHNEEQVCYGRFTVNHGKIFYRLHQFFRDDAGVDELHWLAAQTWHAADSDCRRFFTSALADSGCQGHQKVVPLRPARKGQ